MLTSATRPRWAGRRAGLWLRYAAVKIGPAPLAPHSAPAKRASWSGAPNQRRRIRACKAARGLKQRGAALAGVAERTPRPTRTTNHPLRRTVDPAARGKASDRVGDRRRKSRRPWRAIVVYGRPLVKAGLRPPPSAASGLDEGTPIDPSRRRGIDGQDWQATHSKQRGPPKSPLDKHIPIRARGCCGALPVAGTSEPA